MISKDQNEALITVGQAALSNPEWTAYAHYCFDREKGLRKRALEHLDRFLEISLQWPLEKKIDFVNFLFPYIEGLPTGGDGLLSYFLSHKLIKPTLKAWCDTETTNGNPLRWYGTFYRSEAHLHQALNMNPDDDRARQTLIDWWSYTIYFSVHHLPDGYLGNPDNDLQLGVKISEYIQRLTQPRLREYWTKELEDDLELVRNYIDWKASGHTDFKTWGQERNLRTGYGIARTYYYKK